MFGDCFQALNVRRTVPNFTLMQNPTLTSLPTRRSHTLRQQAAFLLAFVLVLMGVNVGLFEVLRSELDSAATSLTLQADAYRLSKRLQILAGSSPPSSAPVSDASARDIDVELQRFDQVDFSAGLSHQAGSELDLLLVGLRGDWARLRQAYGAWATARQAGAAQGQLENLERAASELQASVVAIGFVHEREVRDEAKRLQRWVYVLVVVDAVLLIGFFYLFRRRVVLPLERITETAARVAEADFTARVTVEGNDEVTRLGSVLNLATARVQALLAQLHGERDRLRKLQRAVDQSPASVIITDARGVIEYTNPQFTVLTGYLPAEAIGQTPKIVSSGQTSEGIYREMWLRLLGGHDWSGEILNRKKDGELFWEHMVASPVRDDDGMITHFIAVKEDITARKKAEGSLLRVNRALQVLSACNQALVHADSPGHLLSAACQSLVGAGGLSLAYVGIASSDDASLVSLDVCAGEASDFAWGQTDVDRGKGAAGECIRRAEYFVCRQAGPEPAGLGDYDGVGGHGLAARICLPLVNDGLVYGALCLYSTDDQAFAEDEVGLLRELADDLAYGLVVFETRELGKSQARELAIRERAMESTRNGIMITRADPLADNPIIYVNHAFERMTGFSRADATDRNPRFLVTGVADQTELERVRDALRRGVESESILRNVRANGTEFWNELSLSPIRDEHGVVTHFVSIFNDVTDRVRYEQELRHHVTHDTLTGLANRTLLADRIEQTVAHAARSERKAAVLMIDLDRFKLINDSLGHQAGDALLREAASRLTDILRSGDTLARVGSDEFVIVLAELQVAEEARLAAETVIQTLSAPYHLFGNEVFCGASVGISLAPDDSVVAQTLVKFAEVAMYTSKGLGGGAQSFYAQNLAQTARDRLSLESDLRRAIERGELELFYQPKVRSHDYRLVGGEALIRWRHPERGMISPIQFIPIAEETGLIIPIGDWVIETALGHILAWSEAGLTVPTISVNLSPRQFRQPDLVGRVKALIEQAGVAPQTLELEVTEGMVMHNPASVLGMLRELREYGVQFSLDDFGTGYSSLSYLHQFPIDTLKIDQSFVRDLAESRDSRVLTETIINMARNLGKKVVAEGVETVEQAEVLKSIGCDVIQGYMFSPAVPAKEFAEFLRAGFLLPNKL